uniref:Uncharacterized protein n=1 Tax=Pyxicephalus adspersus TaxID=30357 RepID=A0AAV3ANG3_PYXAD|nr:TPA: hypothetical protein GDO54_014555 [Pyxicephalus adspersus]
MTTQKRRMYKGMPGIHSSILHSSRSTGIMLSQLRRLSGHKLQKQAREEEPLSPENRTGEKHNSFKIGLCHHLYLLQGTITI